MYNPDKQTRGHFSRHCWNKLCQLQKPKLLVSPEEILDTSYVVGGIIWVNENCSARPHSRNSQMHYNSNFQNSQPLSYPNWVPVLKRISVRTILILPYRHIFFSLKIDTEIFQLNIFMHILCLHFFYMYRPLPLLDWTPQTAVPQGYKFWSPFCCTLFYSFLWWQYIFHNILSSNR